VPPTMCARGHAARWVSSAAQTYRDRVARDRAQADRAADELERAAAVLHAHAEQVRETLAAIAKAEREARAWFERQARNVADTVEDAVDSAGRVVKKLVNEAPWTTWPIGPHNLPAPGDARWLEVGRFMQGKGVL
jgi:ABC-type transporter Mla subunit MlaD